MEIELFTVICRTCKSEATVGMGDDGACGDPECCGAASYRLEIHCKNCPQHETVYL